jgi:radical SAM protein with 4Fe4S-binding SPASM domain
MELSDAAPINTEMLDKLKQRAAWREVPLMASFELTYQCQWHCIHCYVVRDDPYSAEMSLEHWKRAADELADMGGFLLVLTGGEPLLYPHFWELLEHLHKRRFYTRLFTNGALLTDDDVDRLVANGVATVDMSLHGPDAATHDAVSAQPGSFERIMKVIRKIKTTKLHLSLKTNLLLQNYQEVDRWRKLVESLGAMAKLSVMISPSNDGDMAPISLGLKEKEMIQVLEHKVIREVYLGDSLPDEKASERPPLHAVNCSAGLTTINIAPNGEVFPCLQFQLSLGNIQNQSLERIWAHSSNRYYLDGVRYIYAEGCQGCELSAHCGRCPGIAYVETGSCWKPPPATCEKTQELINARRRFSS